jgi:hypothetical protein
MAFDWKDYVDLARFLQQQAPNAGNQEAFLRTAISRAYYAAFCHVRNYARDHSGFIPRNDGDDHGRLREHLRKGKMAGIGKRLQRLREWRNECDYLDQLNIDLQSVLVSALAEADRVFAALPREGPSASP